MWRTDWRTDRWIFAILESLSRLKNWIKISFVKLELSFNQQFFAFVNYMDLFFQHQFSTPIVVYFCNTMEKHPDVVQLESHFTFWQRLSKFLLSRTSILHTLTQECYLMVVFVTFCTSSSSLYVALSAFYRWTTSRGVSWKLAKYLLKQD